MDGSCTKALDHGEAKGRDRFALNLSSHELAAVEGWRAANNIPSTAQALRELVRLGLLSEISKLHSVVSSIRRSVDRGQPAKDRDVVLDR